MVAHALRPGIGAVGAMLCGEDGSVRHAGIVLGFDGAAHLTRGLRPDSGGCRNRLLLAQEFSAVTGACMLVPRRAWDDAGGFDEELAADRSAIDLCLKLRRRGYRVVWTPFARLWQREPAAIDPAEGPENTERRTADLLKLKERWPAAFAADPFHNPNLSPAADGSLALPPRVWYPWNAPEDKSKSGDRFT
jgi:hypothetical protein